MRNFKVFCWTSCEVNEGSDVAEVNLFPNRVPRDDLYGLDSPNFITGLRITEWMSLLRVHSLDHCAISPDPMVKFKCGFISPNLRSQMHWSLDWKGVCYYLIVSVFSSSPSPFPHFQGFLVGKAEVQVASRLLQVSYISSHRSLGPRQWTVMHRVRLQMLAHGSTVSRNKEI